MGNVRYLRRPRSDQASFTTTSTIAWAASTRLAGPKNATYASPSPLSPTPTITPQMSSINRVVVPPFPTSCCTVCVTTGMASSMVVARLVSESQTHRHLVPVWEWGEGVQDGEVPTFDNRYSTNATGIVSWRRSHASNVKVDAPSVVEGAPASVEPGVDSLAVCSSTKTVEKRCPPYADHSHQSATPLDFEMGGGSNGTDLCQNGSGSPHVVL